MKRTKKFFCFVLCYVCFAAHGYSLHVGDKSFVLSQNKYTSPALHVSVNGTTFYGALHSGTAPDKTLHIQHGDNFWLGQNCDAGTYSADGIASCQNCGIGHYCSGAMTRNPCTYGAISCNDTNYGTDPAAPNGAPINTLMTLDEVNEFIPITNFSDWRQISCCSSPQYPEANPDNPSALNNSQYACATGTLGPGTYLFTAYYRSAGFSTTINSISGETGSMSNAYIAVFDHPVSYATFHGHKIFQHFIDTEHSTYTKWTFSTAAPNNSAWQTNKNETNISNLKNILDGSWAMLCVYELK